MDARNHAESAAIVCPKHAAESTVNALHFAVTPTAYRTLLTDTQTRSPDDPVRMDP
jgi:hypothetical protein